MSDSTVNWVVTGSSSGLGLELCRQILAASDKNKVYATVRARKSSGPSGEDKISVLEAESSGRLVILEGIDIGKDEVVEKLREKMAGVELDVIIHNAGSLTGHAQERTGDFAWGNVMGVWGGQSLWKINMDEMRSTFEVNTLGPLRVQQWLNPQMRSGDGVLTKVIQISTGMGSIGNNTGGGLYAYRTSKWGWNMVGKNMACDLKKQGTAVWILTPGAVFTEFAPEMAIKNIGSDWRTADAAASDILKVVDELTLEKSGEGLVRSSPPDGVEKGSLMVW